MATVHVFETHAAANAHVKTIGGMGFWLGPHFGHTTGLNVAVFTPGSRAYALGLAIVEGARGQQSPAPGWFARGFTSMGEANQVEPALQAIPGEAWAKYLAYAGDEFSSPDYTGEDGKTYEEFLVANGLPVLTGAADGYVEALGEHFLGD